MPSNDTRSLVVVAGGVAAVVMMIVGVIVGMIVAVVAVTIRTVVSTGVFIIALLRMGTKKLMIINFSIINIMILNIGAVRTVDQRIVSSREQQ
jgi:hypothetical protein